MRNSSSQAEILFSQALELPGGKARSDFLARRCASDLDLRREVESLLQAHAEAGTFLELPGETTVSGPSHPEPVKTRTSLSAAAHAATYLQRNEDSLGPAPDKYLAALPEDVRQETRERIAAGLQVRRLNASSPKVPTSGVLAEPHFSGYRLEGKIGEGSLGIVYRAYDEKLNRAVAIKVLRSQVDQPTGRRLLNEARQAAGLNDPAIVTIFSVLDERPPAAIVMELAEGFPIDRYAAQLSFEQKARLLRDVSRGLGVAHARGLIHRDLKPDNVIVGPDMRPRILDFGLALSLEEAATQARGFEGTPLYASPEQVRGGALSPASDVFSFGCLMFKVLTGRPPFSGGTVAEVLEAIATTSPPLLREVAFGVPEDLQAICLACLAWDPADRPTAPEVTLELGRFIAGEPVGVRPRLYDDLLRRSISEYSLQTGKWLSQSIISREERDALEVVHRRLLADEDHWIIDARRITLPQTMLSAGTWLTVVATALTVWMLRQDLGPLWRWLLPVCFTFTLLLAGYWAQRLKEQLAAATFLAGAALAIAPSTLALLAEMHLLDHPVAGVAQLFPGSFSNQQVAAASCTALAISALSLWRLKMTGFAWTTAALACATYLSFLLLFNWLEQKPEIQAFWCLPLIALEPLALWLEKSGRVRWTLPFHLAALIALIAGLDVIAYSGPTLRLLGMEKLGWRYLDDGRLHAFSFALNGLMFLGLMLLTERSRSLDLRRASKLLEVLAILHTLSALFLNALQHRDAPFVRADVWIYLVTATLFVAVAPFRSRWRILVGGLAGCGLGSYLLVDLGLVNRQPFIIALGLLGLAAALGAFAYVRQRQRTH